MSAVRPILYGVERILDFLPALNLLHILKVNVEIFEHNVVFWFNKVVGRSNQAFAYSNENVNSNKNEG